jgi:hypothetical protein
MTMRRSRIGFTLTAALISAVLGFSAERGVYGEVVGNTWTPIGPAPINGFFAGGVVGRASTITVNPFNGDEVWLGTASGGVWYSNDGAIHWYPLTDDQEALAIGAIAVRGCDATGCSQILVGTGENAIRRDTYYGRGFLVGDLESPGMPPIYTWTLHDGNPGANFALGSINDVVVDPSVLDGGPIYVTLSSGVTSSASQSTLTAPEPAITGYGIFMTTDTGASWTKLTIPGSTAALPSDLEMHPDDEQTLYAGFLGLGIFKTADGGTNWCPLSPGIALPPGCTAKNWSPDPTATDFDWVEIAISPSNPVVMYASFGHCEDQLLNRCLPSVYRTADGGETWFRRLTGDPNEGDFNSKPYGYSRYTHALTVHPDQGNEVFMGGMRLFRSINGMGSVALADTNKAKGPTQWGNKIHLDHHDVVFDPTDSTHIYNVNDGGVYVTTNLSEGWVPRNSLGLQITGFHSLTLGPGILLGGAQDNGIMVYDGLPVWESQDLKGDGGFTVVDAADGSRWYALLHEGNVNSTANQGGSWCEVNSGLPCCEKRNMYVPFVQDPSPPHAVYWGGQSLWRSPRATGSSCSGNMLFEQVSPILETGDQDEVIGGKDALSAIAVAPSDQNRIYIGYYGGGIYRTDGACDQLSCWTTIGAGLPDQPITRIAVHPTLRDTVILTLSGFDAEAKVWKTTDAGANWAASAAGLPTGVPANTVHYEPGFVDRLWLGMDGNPTAASIYKSVDGGANWLPWSTNLPNVPVYDMTFFEPGGLIFVGTHGRGAFFLGGGLVIKKVVWKDGLSKAIGISGMGLPSSSPCTVDVIREDDTACASGSTDAMGAEMRTDAAGMLVTDRADFYSDRPMAWACFEDTCVGDTPADECRLPANPPSRLALICGRETHFVDLTGPPVTPDPPPAHLGVTIPPGSVAGGSFDLSPVIYGADGTTRALCTANVDVTTDDDNNAILARAEQALNNSVTCQAAGVAALLSHGGDQSSEDDFERDDTLYLSAPGEMGTQIVPAIHAAPGEAQNLCFSLFKLRQPVTGQSQPMAFRILTDPAGTMGGDLTLIQNSPFGSCAITIPTTAGQNSFDLATQFEAALQASGIPGPNPDCPASANVRDVVAVGDTVSMVFASDVQICTSDPGIGFLMQPDGTASFPPAAVATVAAATECTSPAGASVFLNGDSSTDPDSSPGTNDDIILFEWFEDFGLASQVLLGTGEQLSVPLPLGDHALTLRVTDGAGVADRQDVLTTVVDTTSPTAPGIATPDLLWPAHHGMVTVNTGLTPTDACTPDADLVPVLVATISDEPDDAPGPLDGETVDDIEDAQLGTTDFSVRLRAERDSSLAGRTYTLTYDVSDVGGNVASAPLTVFVPIDVDGVVEPILITVTTTPVGTLLNWTAHPDTSAYNVIRVQVSNITDTGNAYDLGPAVCVEALSADSNTLGNEDALDPASGEIFGYLISPNDQQGSYGTPSAGKPRALPVDPCTL